ncbi:hypothetical protein BDV25DRAFT_125962 [Aspergillus avenaceus]|uniref:Uncharacterized protein n=1 Tax=Aspergillus avenaceus TaxID=36643 RepID=A0A5N6UAM2_ASPAV|nr:hypothetical protein BDV25DRAFT_125962 [Aspergillus avenaceus]
MSGETNAHLKTSLGGFSEITAMSQRSINIAVDNLRKQYPDINTISIENDRGDQLDATIDHSEISLHVTGADRSSLEYRVYFESGTLSFFAKTPLSYDVTGWLIVFDVDLNTDKLASGSDEETRVKALLDQAGDYWIASLFIVFNGKNIFVHFSLDRCDLKGADMSQDYLNSFGALLAKWYVNDGPFTDQQKRTIGYGLQTAKPDTVNSQAPSFPPTSLKFQTYEYIAPGQKDPKEGIPDGDNNVLLYLQMTGNHDFPSGAILNYSGNFVPDGMRGTMCFERNIIWDQYLLRETEPQLLHMLNRSTYLWVDSGSVSDPFHPEFKIGMGDTSHPGNLGFFQWNSVNGQPMNWEWQPKNSEQHIDKIYDGTTENHLSTSSNSSAIYASGESHINVQVDFGEGMIVPTGYKYKLHIWIEWSTEITLEAVEDGGLQVSLNLDDDTFNVRSDPVYYDGNYIGLTRQQVVERQEKIVDNLKAYLTKLPLHDAEKQLQANLKSAARFVVPGIGRLHYKNPVFNDHGDLMIEVDYRTDN